MQATQAPGSRKVEFLLNSKCRETRDVDAVLAEAILALDRGVKPDLGEPCTSYPRMHCMGLFRGMTRLFLAPNTVEDGLGGTYFIKDRTGHSIAVFKPRDEEALAPNNPKAHVGAGRGNGMKEGILVGEAAVNEYAAFLVDQSSSLGLRAGVCATALVRMAHSVFHSASEDRSSVFRSVKDKVGSFQLFAQVSWRVP